MQETKCLLRAVAARCLCWQALQLFFVFSPAYPWPQELPVRLMLLAAPMAIWLVLLPLTWSAFTAVMTLLGQPWAQEAAGQGDCIGLAAPGELQPPDVLQPLMKGAWLVSVLDLRHLLRTVLDACNSTDRLSESQWPTLAVRSWLRLPKSEPACACLLLPRSSKALVLLALVDTCQSARTTASWP